MRSCTIWPASCSDLDEIDRHTPVALGYLWRKIVASRNGNISGGSQEGRVFHVGWSPARERFVAYAYSSEDDFERVDLTDHRVFCAPVP